MITIYALYNQRNNKIYIGQSENLGERLKAHKDKRFKQCYTARFDGEWQLIYQEEVATRSQAIAREKQLKSFCGREFIRSLIKK